MYELPLYFLNGEVHENSAIEVLMVVPNGEHETAEDSEGILRGAMSEFWTMCSEINKPL